MPKTIKKNETSVQDQINEINGRHGVGEREENGLKSYEEFFTTAIKLLPKPYKNKQGKEMPASKGIFSRNVNAAFTAYYGKGHDVQAITKKLADEGIISIQPRRGGVMFYLPQDAPQSAQTPDDTLAAMGFR